MYYKRLLSYTDYSSRDNERMPQKREVMVAIRLNEEEALRLDKICRAKGLGRSGYIRMKLLECMERDERAQQIEEN